MKLLIALLVVVALCAGAADAIRFRTRVTGSKCCCCDDKGTALDRSFKCSEYDMQKKCNGNNNHWMEIDESKSCRTECKIYGGSVRQTTPSASASASTPAPSSSSPSSSTPSSSSSTPAPVQKKDEEKGTKSDSSASASSSASSDVSKKDGTCAYIPGATRPPHKGHFGMALAAAKQLPGSTVVIVVTGNKANDKHGVDGELSRQIWQDYYIPLLKKKGIDAALVYTDNRDPHKAAWEHGMKNCGCSAEHECTVFAGPDRAGYADIAPKGIKYSVFKERIGGADISATELCKSLFTNKDKLTSEFKAKFSAEYLPEGVDKADELISAMAAKCNGK